MKKRLLAAFLSAAMLVMMLPAAFAASDISGHWAETYITYLNDEGVYKPSATTGNYEPNREMTRAEFMRYINRAFHFTETTSVSFDDVQSSAWYYETIQIAMKYGYIAGVGGNKMDPEGTITREQVAVIIGRLFKEDPGTVAPSALSFSDSANISDWSAGYIRAAADKGFLTGYTNGTFQPKRVITRAEVAKILYFYLGTALSTEGKAYTGAELKNDTTNVTISESCSLSDATIAGDLYITEGVGTNSVALTNVKVQGSIIISGGTVTMTNTTSDHMVVSSPMGRLLQVTATGASHIGSTEVLSSAGLYERGLTTAGYEGFADVSVSAEDKNALTLTLGSALTNLKLLTNATISMAAGSSIYTLDTADAAAITGYGTIYQANIHKNGVSISMVPAGYTLDSGVKATIGGVEVSESSSTTIAPTTISVDLNNLTPLGSAVDIAVPSGLTVSTAALDGVILSPSTAYTATSSGISVLTSYLSTLKQGGHTLTLTLSDGKKATVAVSVTNTDVHADATELSFDRYYKASGFQDLSVRITGVTDASDIASVVLGMAALDYRFDTATHTVSFSRGTLAQLRAGTYTITVDLADGTQQLVLLHVTDSSPAGQNFLVICYDTYAPTEPTLYLNLASRTVTSVSTVKSGVTSTLVEGTDYVIGTNSIQLKKAALERFRVSNTTVEFTITFNTGATTALIVDYL